MSLQVWLPLNGNLTNQGLSPATFSVVNSGGGLASSTSGGKVVSGAYTRTTANTASYIKSDINFSFSGDFSMCCWAKVTGIGSVQNANGIITHHSHITGGGGITMKEVSSTDLRMSINTGTDSNNRTYRTYYGSTNIYNQWHHLCVTYERSTQRYRMYVDGRKETIVGYGDYVTFGDTVAARPFCLFAWSTDYLASAEYRPPCQLNDVRLYDHLLSPKEIHEIAKGLVCHYPLKFMSQENLLEGAEKYTEANPLIRKASDVSHMYDSYIYHSELVANIPSDGTYTFKINTDGNPTGHPTSGTTGSQRLISMWLQNQTTGNHYHFAGSRGIGTEIYGTQTLPAGKYTVRTNLYAADSANYTLKIWNMKVVSGNYDPNDIYYNYKYDRLGYAGLHYFDTTDMAAVARVKDQYIFMETLSAAEQIAATLATSTFFFRSIESNPYMDVSGYQRHLTTSGYPTTCDTSSPRYSNSVDFDQKSYGYTDSFNMITDNFTIAFWSKFPSAINNQHFMLGTFNSLTNNGFGLWRDVGESKYFSLIKSSSQSYSGGPALAFSANSWDHYAYTYNNSVLIFYKNGVEQGRTSYSGTVSHPVLYLGNALYGDRGTENDECSMSDFRFYATALSAADIQELAKVGGTIDRNGEISAYEFYEDDRNAVHKNGTIAYSGINEKSAPLYEMKTKVLDDRSVWARIHHLDVTTNPTYFQSSAEADYCINQYNRYSRIKDITKYKQSDGYEFMLTYPEITRKLPAGYTKLKCIEATGTQYIKTGVTGAGRWEFDIQFTNTSTRQLMGYGSSSDEYWGCQDNGGYGLFNSNTRGSAGGRDTIVHDAQNFLLQVQNQSLTGIATTNVSSKEYQIFAIDGGYNCKAKLYRCSCIKGTSLIRDFIPAQRQSDGVVGLYDTVTGGFYANSGSGTFRYEYDGYQTLEYIQGNNGACINTKQKTSGVQIKVEATFMISTGGRRYNLYGNFAEDNGGNCLNIEVNASNLMRVYMNDAHDITGGTITPGTKYTMSFTLNNGTNYSLLLNGTQVMSGSYSTQVSSKYCAKLFTDCRNSSGSTFSSQMTIYNMKITYTYSDGCRVQNFIPCVNNRGEIGMLETETGEFYANQGSGSFTGGPMRESLPLYNRWIQNTWTTDVNQGDNISYQMITTAWPAHSGPIKPANSSDTKYDCDNKATGNWYAPIGQYRAWEGGIPAADSNPRKKTELWVRIDRANPDTKQCKIYNGSIAAAAFNEI